MKNKINIKSEQFVEEVVSAQKRVNPNPYLKSRTMAAIESKNFSYQRRMTRYFEYSYYLCLVISIVSAIYLGNSLGESYYKAEGTEISGPGSSYIFFEDGVESQFLLMRVD